MSDKLVTRPECGYSIVQAMNEMVRLYAVGYQMTSPNSVKLIIKEVATIKNRLFEGVATKTLHEFEERYLLLYEADTAESEQFCNEWIQAAVLWGNSAVAEAGIIIKELKDYHKSLISEL